MTAYRSPKPETGSFGVVLCFGDSIGDICQSVKHKMIIYKKYFQASIDILSKYAKIQPMNINEWQNKQQISNAELAKNMGISISYLSRIKRGLRRLSPEKAEHTETITGGAVSVMELLFPAANNKTGRKDEQARS